MDLTSLVQRADEQITYFATLPKSGECPGDPGLAFPLAPAAFNRN